MDYEALLKKYIAHVVSCEGVDFINYGAEYSEIKFTAEERVELERLARAAMEEQNG